ncbi:MAG: LysR family transcriptional regulator [Deltaproteobacteria bacterium]|nr:LysR family transcriptional regulator [Deltaproteobacteria bacterium]
MDFRRLEVFQKVFELKSFSRAGQELLLAQPTISEHIRLLEADLGLVLFDRRGKEVVPTRAADLLYDHAVRLEALRRETLRAMQQFLDKDQGELMVGGSNIPGQYLLPGILGQFKKKYPRIRVRLWIDDTKNMVEKLQAGVVDLGVVGAAVDQDRVTCRLLTKDELVCIRPGDSDGRNTLDPDDLRSAPFILREAGSGTRKTIEAALQKIGLKAEDLQVVAEMGSNEAIRQAVKAGVGISVISRRAVAEDLATGTIKEIKIRKFPLFRNFYLITMKQRTLSPLAQEFVDFLIEKV